MDLRVCSLTTLLLTALSVGCAMRRTQDLSHELQTKVLNAPTVTYCDLLSSADRYDGTIVRVRGLYSTDFEASQFGSPECGGLDLLSTWVDFDSDYERMTERKWQKKIEHVKWRQPVDVVFIGRFETKRSNASYPGQGFGHMDMYPWRIVVMSVEQVQALGKFRPLPVGTRR